MTQHIPTAGLAVDVAPSTASLTDASFGRRLLSVGPTTVVVAAGLTALEWSVMQLPENAAGTAASIGALAMTVPLVIARRRPVVAVAVLAVAAVMNGLLFGDFTRCAGAVPAVLFAAFAVGAWSRGTQPCAGPASLVGAAARPRRHRGAVPLGPGVARRRGVPGHGSGRRPRGLGGRDRMGRADGPSRAPLTPPPSREAGAAPNRCGAGPTGSTITSTKETRP